LVLKTSLNEILDLKLKNRNTKAELKYISEKIKANQKCYINIELQIF